jgi:hypothetical protein
MNSLDIFIIYLACGAPVGVYYFLQNRGSIQSNTFWLKTLFTFLFWMPSAFFLLRQNKSLKIASVFSFDKTSQLDSKREERFQSIQKRIEKNLLDGKLKISIYELREIVERYIGLSLAAENESEEVCKQEAEIFRISEIKNIELGAVCLKRRNRKRLSFHQTEARKDFLHLIKQLSESDSNVKDIKSQAIELVKLLKDLKAQAALEKNFAGHLQTGETIRVQALEKNLWKPELPKLVSAKQTSHLPALTPTVTNSLRKD